MENHTKSYNISFPFLALSLVLATACGGSSGGANSNPRNPYGNGPAAVSLSSNGANLIPGDLGSAGNYALLAKSGISDIATDVTRITGNIGVSPIGAVGITNFSLTELGTLVR